MKQQIAGKILGEERPNSVCNELLPMDLQRLELTQVKTQSKNH